MGRPWTQEEIQVVIDMYADNYAYEIAAKIGRTPGGVYGQAYKLGLRSSKEKIIRSGRMSSTNPNTINARFKKGHKPHNKGKSVSPEVYEKIKGTLFKKGQRPKNWRPIGSERVTVDGYVEVKVSEHMWKLKHRLIWEEANGEIPDGFNIQFKNGNTQDVRLDNLYIISRADQLGKENSIHSRYPEELKVVIRLKGAIKRQITEHKKKNRDGKEC